MQHDNTPRVTRFTDPDGTPCVRVLLSDHTSTAELYAEDYDRLIEQGVTSSWQAAVPNRKTRKRLRIYVQSRNPVPYPMRKGTQDSCQMVARLLVQAGRGEQVRYHDGNTLNLRSDNLRVTEGPARRDSVVILDALAGSTSTVAKGADQ